MLTEKRINEAKSNVRMYINDKLLRKEEFKNQLDLGNHKKDSSVTFISQNNSKTRWT